MLQAVDTPQMPQAEVNQAGFSVGADLSQGRSAHTKLLEGEELETPPGCEVPKLIRISQSRGRIKNPAPKILN